MSTLTSTPPPTSPPQISTPLHHHLISWFLFILILPLVILTLLPLRLYKLILITITKLIPSLHLKSPLTGYDSIFAIDNYNHPFAANCTYIILKNPIKIEDLRSKFRSEILQGNPQNYDRLHSIPTKFGGYYFWKDIDVDLNQCVYKYCDIEQDGLNELLGEVMTKRFNTDALWELLLVGFKEGGCVVVFRLHHVLGDGYTANHIVDRLLGGVSYYRGGEGQVGQSWWSKLQLILKFPHRLATLYLSAFTHRGQDQFTKNKMSTTGFVSMTSLSLDRFKVLRRKTNVHFVTIGMVLMTSALKRWFDEKNDHPTSTTPPTISIMHSLPRPSHPLKRMTNHWAVGIFHIPYKTTSPLTRLLQAEHNFNTYINANYKEIIHYHMPLFNLLPAVAIKLFFSFNFGTGCGFTSMPGLGEGKDVKLELCGGEVSGMWKVFGFQWSQTAIASAIYTSTNHLGFTMYANKDIIPTQADLNVITEKYLVQELELIENELINNNSCSSKKDV